ncbi:MAG: DUF916 domain-containing protein [Parcubacteria group bacterium]
MRRKILVQGGTVLALFMISISPVFAIEYGGFGGRPAYPQANNPRTESIFVHTLEPGSIQQEGIRVVNNSAETKTMLVYAADSTPSTGGAFACKQFSEAKSDVGAWISLKKSEVTLESNTNEIVPFTINIPKTAGVGEHNGCILIQEKKPQTNSQTGVSLSVRTGLRVAITIPGVLTRKLEIAGFTMTPQADKILLHPLVKNIGNVSIDADVGVLTTYFFGVEFAENGGQYPILRGETSDWNFELKKPFWGGWYRSEFSVNYDSGATAGVGVKSGEKLTRLEGGSIWFWSAPKPPALAVEIVVFLSLVACLFLLWLSQKRKRWIKKNWVDCTVGQNENINALSERFDVSWQLLAKVNKLKPPYELKEGQHIKRPPVA